MAVFNLGSGTELNNLDSMDKVKSYLFTLTEQLRYMFNNLDPDDNYSAHARLTMVTDGQRQATIEASLDKILLSYVSKDNIVSSINLSEELIQIEASKIKLEGVVTVNGNFKIGLDGSIEATNGKFNGDIEASNISGSEIRGSEIHGAHIYGSFIGTENDAFYVIEDTYDGHQTVKIGLSGFWNENYKLRTNWIGSVANPALNDDDDAGINGSTGDAGFRKLYLLDDYYIGSDNEMWDVTRTIKWLDNRISALEQGCGSDCGSDDCDCAGDCQAYDWQCPTEGDDPYDPEVPCAGEGD